MLNGQKINKYIIISFGILSIIVVSFYTLYCTKGFFHSDMASYLLLAKEQIAKKQFFPDNFCYGTGIFIITAELFIVPLMFFISDWLLCREIAVIILNLIVAFLACFMFRNADKEKKLTIAPFIVLILWCLPMEQYQQTIYEAAYVPFSLFELCIMIFLQKIIADETKKINYFIFFLLVFMANLGGINNIVVMVLPLIAAIAIYLVIENYKCLDQLFRQKCYNFLILIIILAAALAMINYNSLVKMVGIKADAGICFANSEAISNNFRNLILGIFQYYGAIGNGSIFSIGGIVSCFHFIVMLVSSIIIPFVLIFSYRKLESKFWKIYILYCWISNFLVIYAMIFTSSNSIRYYYTIFWHNIILAGLFLGYLIRTSHKYIGSFLIITIASVCIMGHFCYFSGVVEMMKAKYEDEEKNGTITEFLEENNLTYGFATYWNAYNNMVLSDGKVTIVAWNGQPNQPLYWLTSKDWYDPKTYPGRCFILLKQGETIDDKYYSLASEVKQFREYSILVFEQHIYLYEN